MVSGLDEEGLVDSRMVHVMGSCCHQTQEYVQRTQMLCQLQHSNVCSLHRRKTWTHFKEILKKACLLDCEKTRVLWKIILSLTSAQFSYYCHFLGLFLQLVLTKEVVYEILNIHAVA